MKKQSKHGSIYTLLIDYDGGTYISRWSATSPKRAIIKWSRLFDFSVIPHVRNSWLDEFREEIKRESPTRITGTVGVWCGGAILGNKYVLINIVRTAATRSNPSI
jgi:hypothetical protein